MGTATSIRLTKPRISAMILEGTAAVVSVVLVLWLLLWFIHRTVQKDRVEAYSLKDSDIPAEEVPFQAADVRRFRGSPESSKIPETRSTELAAEVLKKVGSPGNPLVVYISAPMLGQGAKAPGDSILRLIGDVARGSKRDVVLALDLAQIDSDRDLGRFGNSPYSQLPKQIQDTIRESGKPSKSVFVMTSAAPAQKSWSADGLGQSIFAYYLREGLEGEARGWDATEPERITVEGLHRYVRDRVRRWARSCRESTQTPLLLPILPEGDKPSKVSLQTIPKGAPGPASRARRSVDIRQAATDAGRAKPDVEGKSGPATVEEVAQSPPTDVDELFKEWAAHDLLAKRTPYRDLPGAWRSYEAALLRAERGLRAAHKDPAIWDQGARAALDEARKRGDQLKTDLESRERARKDFPFRPVQGDRQGAQELAAALRFLHPKIRLPAWLELASAPAAEPKAVADKEPGKAGPGAEVANPPAPFPSAFSTPASEAPSPFLELQLPRWAYRFAADFNCENYFRDPGRAEVLVRLVELRAKAEAALPTDRRGLPWIKPLIERGDRGRRTIQDRLFGMPSNAAVAEQETQLARVGAAYDAAMEGIRKFHDARDTWEQAVDELPYLAEWAIRIRPLPGAGTSALPSNPLPEPVDGALRAIETLARALSPPPADVEENVESPAVTREERLRRLADAAGDVREKMRALKDQFNQMTDRYGNGRSPGWIELDAALRIPSLDLKKRRSLLDRLLDLSDSTDDDGGKPGEMEADSPPDRGFWIRAAGLARLDLELRRLGQGSADPDAFEAATVQKAWAAVRQTPDDRGAAQGALPLFARLSETVGRLRAAVRDGLVETAGDDANRDPGEVEKELRARDGEVRCLTATEADQLVSTIDRPVRDYQTLANCACREFHLARLEADYAGDQSLIRLASEIDGLRKSLRIKPTTPPAPRGAGLSVRVTPGGRREIDESWKTDFNVIVEGSPPARGQRPMPDGEAFVGLAAAGPADGLAINGRAVGSDVPGGRIRVPIDREAPGPVSFEVEQKTDMVKLRADAEALDLDAKVFYRGQSDQAEPARVAVKPNKVPTRIAIRISQDQDKLRNKYPGAPDFPDQFRRHPQKGYMHKDKDLDYIIAIENKTPRPLNVTCRRFLIDDMTGQKTEINAPPIVNQPLHPGKPIKIQGNIKLATASNGRPLRLRVEVSDKLGAIDPYEVTFEEIGWNRYMKVTSGNERNFAFVKDGQNFVEPCFIVTMQRDGDDPVTEPIRGEELRCEFTAENLNEVHLGSERRRWLLPGDDPITFYQPLHAVKLPIKWKAQIENEALPLKVGNAGD